MSQRAPRERPSNEDVDVQEEADVSPAAVRALESRVSDLEDLLEAKESTIVDLVRMVNDLQDRVAELEPDE